MQLLLVRTLMLQLNALLRLERPQKQPVQPLLLVVHQLMLLV